MEHLCKKFLTLLLSSRIYHICTVTNIFPRFKITTRIKTLKLSCDTKSDLFSRLKVFSRKSKVCSILKGILYNPRKATEMAAPVELLYSDQSNEYERFGKGFGEVVTRTYSTPYAPELFETAERSNRTIENAVARYCFE